jgi:hypothetical protein
MSHRYENDVETITQTTVLFEGLLDARGGAL